MRSCEAGLTVGRPLDRHLHESSRARVRRAKALAAATRSLAASDRSQRALEQRLARAGHSAAAREDAIAALARAGAIDDARLAESRAELLARRGYGDAAIRADLRRRQIAPEVAASVRRCPSSPSSSGCGGRSRTRASRRRFCGAWPGRGFSRDTLDEIRSSFAFEA
jgi:hypothetical protein